MSYNLTSISGNSSSIVNFVTGVNDVLMFGWLGTLFLIGVTTILFMAFMFYTNDTRKAISASSFIAFGLSIFLSALGLIPPLVLFITLIGSAASIAFIYKNN